MGASRGGARWSSVGLFTTSSAYKTMLHSGVLCRYQKRLWKLKVPTKVRVFLWILLQDQILSQEIMHKRGCHVQQGCAMCGDNEIETTIHLIWLCPYAVRFWMGLLTFVNVRLPARTPDSIVCDIWWKGRGALGEAARCHWDTVWAVRGIDAGPCGESATGEYFQTKQD